MINQPSRALQMGLAFLAGGGLTLMVIAAGVGVVDPNADSAALQLTFALGVALLVSGIIAWFAVVRPDKRFDDINTPQYHGHAHDEAHDDKALAEHP